MFACTWRGPERSGKLIRTVDQMQRKGQIPKDRVLTISLNNIVTNMNKSWLHPQRHAYLPELRLRVSAPLFHITSSPYWTHCVLSAGILTQTHGPTVVWVSAECKLTGEAIYSTLHCLIYRDKILFLLISICMYFPRLVKLYPSNLYRSRSL